MNKNIFTNKYVPLYQEHDTLPWYKQDGFLMYIDALKCEQLLENTDDNLKNVVIVNFGIRHNKCRDNPLENSIQNYMTITNADFKNYLQKKKKVKALSPAMRTERKDL